MILIKKYDSTLKNKWDSFVKKSLNGTIFQTQKFLSYHQEKVFNDHSLLFYYNDKLIAVLPASEMSDKNSKILYSHKGASYGGIIILNTSFSLIESILDALEKYCKRKDFTKIILINSPSIYSDFNNEILEYTLKWKQFNNIETYISHATKLNDISLNLLQSRKRRYIKKIIDSDTFQYKISKSFDDFHQLLTLSKAKYNIKPTHSLEELEILQQLFPKDITLILFYNDKTIIGGSLLFFANQRASLVFYNVINESYRNSQLAVYQLYICMELSQSQNMSYIDFGVSHLPKAANPFEPKKSLIEFKEHFGSIGIIRNVYEKNII